jgi:hypothetical protein
MSERRLSKKFKFIVIAGALGALIFLRGDGEEPDRLPDARSLIVDARPLYVPSGNVDIPTSLSLKLNGAWELKSANSEFGGFSALYVSGPAMTFVSDRGALVRVQRGEQYLRWSGVISALPPGCGEMTSKFDRDTEALAVDSQSGAFWVGFEHRSGICRVASRGQGGTQFRAPPQMKDWYLSKGPEAIVRLRTGGFLVFQEQAKDWTGISQLLYFDRDPVLKGAKVIKMGYRPPTGYLPVDAAQLPDGRLLVLNRRFSLPFNFSNRLSIVEFSRPRAGLVLSGPIVARIDGEGIADNYEGLAVDNDGEDLTIWLVSDNNFLSIQRSLLLRFIWPGAAKARPAKEGRK